MSLIFEVFDGSGWVDKTSKCISLSHRISNREIESLEVELLEHVNVGTRVRLRRSNTVLFEGVVYESSREHRSGDVPRCRFTAYSDLILYDRHVVYRMYDTGTKAGAIIKDLASLESGVNVQNVDESGTPELLAPWPIENQPALEVMQSIARGVNYWLRMKPHKMLYFKPKTTGSYQAIIDSSKIISAEYSEDRWKLKNRVIYVGAGGEVLADVSEGSGDLPVVVHDPFLTDREEAYRRANIRLALNKEYGKQLRVEMHQTDFEAMNIDLGDTIRVNLPSLGLNNVDMYLVEIEYDPRNLRHNITLGGRLELLEEFIDEEIGGDVAARFGRAMTIPELTSTMTFTTERSFRHYSDVKYPIYLNKPPLTLHSSQNIIIDDDGYATLSSGATSGNFTIKILPVSRFFINYIKCEWVVDKNDGAVSVQLMDAEDKVVASVHDACDFQWLIVPRWPIAYAGFTFRNASRFSTVNATVSDKRFGTLNEWCLKMVPNTIGLDGKIIYPSHSMRGLELGLSQFKYMRLYLLGEHTDNFTVDVEFIGEEVSFSYSFSASFSRNTVRKKRAGKINVRKNVWGKYETVLSSLEGDDISKIERIVITSKYPLLIDSDFVFLSFLREVLRLKFTLSRSSPSMNSPTVKLVKIIWREGGVSWSE